MSEIIIDNDNPIFDSRDNCVAIIRTTGNELIAGCKKTVIPNTVKGIAPSAFKGCTGLTSITIPNSVTCIGGFYDIDLMDYFGAFQGCTGLTSITIPSSVISIGGGAFFGCTGLTSITIPNSVTSIGDYAFAGCTGLTDVCCLSSPTFVGSDVFSNCTSIKEVTFDCEKVTSLFRYTSISKITLTDKVTSIGDYAFEYCTGLTDVYCLGSEAPKFDWDYYHEEVKNTILHVKDYAIESFLGIEPWSYFKEIVCELETDFKLTYYVDNEVYKQYEHKYKDVITPEPFPEKEQFTFSGWSEIPSVMPGRDVDIYGTFNPTEVTIDDVVYQIKDGKAYPIKNNKSGEVVISSYVEDRGRRYPVTTIPSGVFGSNVNITFLIIPDGIEVIYARAFYGCKNLATITIGNSISSIGERAFANIDKMEKFICNAENVPSIDRTTFENSYINYATLYVPAGSVEKYKATGPWKDFKEILSIEGTEPGYVETCAMPTISFYNGKLDFNSETDGAECHYEIKVEDAKEGVGSEVTLSSVYEISVYASKEGYNDSEKNTATLYWINVDPTPTGVIENEMRVNTNAILVQNTGGAIAISGVTDGANVMIYNISGQLIAQGRASGSHVEIGTNLYIGDICIIKIADKSMKYLLK